MNNTTNEEAVIEALTLTYEVTPDGSKIYFNKEGQFHRIYGPAVIASDGTIIWCKNGKYHREDGPAVIFADGAEIYYIDGSDLTKEEFTKWQKKKW